MAPLKTFFDDHTTFFHKSFCYKFNYNNNSSTLFKNRLKLIRENFATFNTYYLKDVSACNFSYPTSVMTDEKNNYTWLNEMRSVTSARLELLRKAMVAQSMTRKAEVWYDKMKVKPSNGEFDVSFKHKFQREEVLIKKENYKLILDQIRKRTGDEQQQEILSNHRQRSREICFNATLTKAVSVVSIINNYFNNVQTVLNIGKQIEVFRSMESRLNTLTIFKMVDEASLNNLKILLEDLTSYKNNVIIAIQQKIETCKLEVNNSLKMNIKNMFSVNMSSELVIMNQVKRQYVALIKNHRALFKNLFIVKNLSFINDPNTKLFRQNVTKVINILVNTISFTNPKHLNDKYIKLNSLLNGKLVCIANTCVMIGENNDEALLFCMETLALKIINYAQKIVSIKTESAFELAVIVIKLWSVHPQFGKILFAEMKQRCPFLIPFKYHGKHLNSVKQLDKKLINYNFDSAGNVESNFKHLTGIVRLYAAIIFISSKFDQSIIGLSHAWVFVSTILNQNPIADITAIMLIEFLSINGFIMFQVYQKQFVKLLKYINTHYLKKIILITPTGCEGPIFRLNSFISKSLYTGSIKEPKVILTNFW